MLISFYEEFPTKKNLDKLTLVTWPTKLYLAAPSLKEFNLIKKTLKNKYVQELIYWPILDKKEGYWISPFSKRRALQRVFKELANTKTSVMLDLELPTTQNPLLYITQLPNFLRNKQLIRNFIKQHKGKMYLVEYYPNGRLNEFLLKTIGIHYNESKAYVIKMFYHSMHNFNKEFFVRELAKGQIVFKDKFIPSFGTIATGIHGTEPLLTPKQLEQDLRFAEAAKAQEAILFRLGGLNTKYLPCLKKCGKDI